MKDPLLMAFVDMIEKGPFGSFHLWVLVPGGILAGEAVSTRRYFEEFLEITSFRQVDPMTGDILSTSSMSERISPDDVIVPEEPEYLNLLDPFLTSLQAPMRLSLTRVRLDAIVAWGWGQLHTQP